MTIAGCIILILEDEAIVGLQLEDMIEDAGGSAVFVDHLDQALRIAVETELDTAILDVNVHGSQSYPVADALAARDVPFIFATGYGDRLHPERFAAVPTVTKPYSFTDIEQALIEAKRRSNRATTGR